MATNALNGMQIYIRMFGGNEMVNIYPGWTVWRLKQYLAERHGHRPEQLRVIFAGSELPNSLGFEQSDLGQQSVVHVRVSLQPNGDASGQTTAPLPVCAIAPNFEGIHSQVGAERRAYFYVYCKMVCHSVRTGKLRVRCKSCKDSGFEIAADPDGWADVLQPNKITGRCGVSSCQNNIAEFYFKCGKHEPRSDENDEATPLSLVRTNTRDVPCLTCTDVSDPVLVFPCQHQHVICISCFSMYCENKVNERRFVRVEQPKNIGYTLSCPGGDDGCDSSYIDEIHHFRIAGDNEYGRYQRFATEDLILQTGGILCPGRDCGNGIYAPENQRRVTCDRRSGGCGLTFCRNCLQPFHNGQCRFVNQFGEDRQETDYQINAENARRARWEGETRQSVAKIRQTTKPCPGCGVPIEKNGGCNHMTCSRCRHNWCWICSIEWNERCEGDHWFRAT